MLLRGGQMEAILSRCGYRCDLCLAYAPNVAAHPDYPQLLSDGWFRYFGFRIPAEQIRCDGCLSGSTRLIDAGCPVRPCVLARGYDNCSQCTEYGCDRLQDRLVVFEEVERNAGTTISPEDRARFIRPYENRERLEKLRNGD